MTVDEYIADAKVPEMASTPFSERLRKAREARGMTQAEAAESLGVHWVTFSRWETGANQPKGLALKAAEAWIGRTRKQGGSDAKRS